MSDHPRIRGEHGADRFDGDGLRGSSPHTRGALEPLEWRHEARRIIPAYAGSTSRQSTMKAAMPGSSPHTRGAHPRPCSTMSVRGIIPAYAGSTLGNPCNTKDRRRDYTSFPLPVTHPSGGGGS